MVSPSAQVKRRTKFLWIVIITAPVWALGQIRIIPPSPQPPMEAVAGSPENVDVPQPDLRGLEAIITPPRAPSVPTINITPPPGTPSVENGVVVLPTGPVTPPQSTPSTAAGIRITPPPPPRSTTSSPTGVPAVNISPPGGGWQQNPSSTYNTTNFCGGAFEAEEVGENCPDRPTYYANDRTVTCAARTRTNIAGRYGTEFEDFIEEHVRRASEITGISPALIMALLDAESGFNPMASNSGHDTGMAQFQPSTAQSTLNYWQQTSSSTVRLQSHNLQTSYPSSRCSSRDYPNLSAACRDSLMDENVCGSWERGLRPNLFCPQFAIYMMAWHLKKMSASGAPRNILGQEIHIARALQGDGDPVAQARYLASSYNRGCLIENSFAYYLENNGVITSARNYGALWSSPVSASFRNIRSRPCSTDRVLYTERINRCYIWRVTGLCGGFGDSLVGQYLRQNFCTAGSGSGSQSSPTGGVQ